MSAIKNGVYTVELNGKEYGLLFSLNALDAVQDKFGGYDKLGEIFNDTNQNWVKDTRWLFTLLINEALLAESENATELTEQQVGRLIHLGNMQEIQQAIFASFALGTAGDGDEDNAAESEDAGNEEGETKAVQES